MIRDAVKGRSYFFLCGLLLGVFETCSNTAMAQQPVPEKIDFVQQIAPILEAKCYRCHGSMLRSGGLRLDRRDEVRTGGYSQKPLLGGTLETNEIYLRVASTNAAYRMPKGDEALGADEISLIKRWVEQGATWPEPPAKSNTEDQPSWLDQQAWLNAVERWLNEVPGFIPWLLTMLGLMIGLLLIERYKQAVAKNKPWTAHRGASRLKPLLSFGLPHFLLTVSTMAWILTLLVSRGQTLKLRKITDELNQALSRGHADSSEKSVYGDPPIPQRPGHPPRLRGEYYRGNCERSPKLFNGGNYRTATLRVSLIDSQGRDVNYGDQVDPNNLSIRFELDRPRGTTPELYTDRTVLEGVFLTPQLLSQQPTKLDPPVIRMKEIEPGWKWAATVPLPDLNDSATGVISGLIYAYQGTIENDKGRGSVHYGIKYDLQFKELILQPGSEVWLGSLFWTPTLEHPMLGKVPLKEWFNHEPIPEMTGVNSTDPKLLGLPPGNM